ncbi:MAG: PhnD/SsuA/transferrin family substrate-binding protein [Sulfurimonas sp.]|nr:PhnD/SsuA/transferrin family substrate-binding protein [Sulfurimonas sp.]PHQ91964.1 MAG: hypothetical protein COB42_02520 [Sulfurimonas sp.]
MIRIFLILMCTLSLYSAHINFGYSSSSVNQFSKKDTLIAIKVWIREILRDDEDTIDFFFYDNSKHMIEDLKLGKLDIVITFGLDFVKYIEKSELVNAFAGGMNNRSLDNFILLVHKNSSKKKLLANKNPRIAVQKNEEISKLYLKHYFLKHKGHENINFVDVRKRKEAILKVFFKNADAALVTKKTFEFAKELNPQIGRSLKVIETTNIPAGNFGFFRQGLDPHVRSELVSRALDIINSNRGRQILDIFQIDRVVETKVEELAPIEKLYNDYKILKKG